MGTHTATAGDNACGLQLCADVLARHVLDIPRLCEPLRLSNDFCKAYHTSRSFGTWQHAMACSFNTLPCGLPARRWDVGYGDYRDVAALQSGSWQTPLVESSLELQYGNW
eukprot:3185196-Amphidinium_carterae.1